MPKKKEPTANPDKAEAKKTTTKTETAKAPAKPTKSAEAAKPAGAQQTVAKPAAPAKTESAPAKAAPAPAKAKSTPAKTEKSTASTKSGKTSKTSTTAAKVPASGKRAGSVVTVVVAKYDAGFGNSLYIRGEGADLSWEKSILMKNVENDVWVWTTNEMKEGMLSFKILLNDSPDGWSTGDNLSASAGETTTVTPIF